MKKNYYLLRASLFLIALMFVRNNSFGFEVSVGGLRYEISGDTARVTEPVSSYITECSIPESVTYQGVSYLVRGIGTYAFFHCKNLTSVSIPSSMRRIGYQAFFGCTSLTSVNIPSSVMSIEDETFGDCI